MADPKPTIEAQWEDFRRFILSDDPAATRDSFYGGFCAALNLTGSLGNAERAAILASLDEEMNRYIASFLARKVQESSVR